MLPTKSLTALAAFVLFSATSFAITLPSSPNAAANNNGVTTPTNNVNTQNSTQSNGIYDRSNPTSVVNTSPNRLTAPSPTPPENNSATSAISNDSSPDSTISSPSSTNDQNSYTTPATPAPNTSASAPMQNSMGTTTTSSSPSAPMNPNDPANYNHNTDTSTPMGTHQ